VPFNPPVLPAGTYRIGTIVWDTSGFTAGFDRISTYIDDQVDGVGAIINGNVIVLTSADIVVRTHYLTSDPPCGNGLIEEGWENCDDGNSTSGDGCADWCQIEPGWTCEGEPSVCTADPTPIPSMSTTGVALLGVAVFGVGVVGLVIAARRRLN
jgi:cysteine-rich repeat protein